jgi:hypothetical protein
MISDHNNINSNKINNNNINISKINRDDNIILIVSHKTDITKYSDEITITPNCIAEAWSLYSGKDCDKVLRGIYKNIFDRYIWIEDYYNHITSIDIKDTNKVLFIAGMLSIYGNKK